MPTYEFSCPEGHDFEKFYRSMSAAPTEVACPVCGKPATRRVSGGAGLLFKGSGFYITDYGKDGKKDQTSGSPSKSDGGSKGDAAPAKSDGATPSGSQSSTQSSTQSSAPSSAPTSKSGE